MIRRVRAALRTGGRALALLAALALVLTNAVGPRPASAATPQDPLAALLDICTAHGPSGGSVAADPTDDTTVPAHVHSSCAGCVPV